MWKRLQYCRTLLINTTRVFTTLKQTLEHNLLGALKVEYRAGHGHILFKLSAPGPCLRGSRSTEEKDKDHQSRNQNRDLSKRSTIASLHGITQKGNCDLLGYDFSSLMYSAISWPCLDPSRASSSRKRSPAERLTSHSRGQGWRTGCSYQRRTTQDKDNKLPSSLSLFFFLSFSLSGVNADFL